MNNHSEQEDKQSSRDKNIAKKSAIKAVVGTVIITPIIMVFSNVSCSGSDPLCKSMTPLVGVIYAPIVFIALWVVLYFFYQLTTDGN